MSHSNRCKICCSNYPDCSSHDCSYQWKNRFCKLRKKWSEHSKFGSVKQLPEDCPYSRCPCDQTVGRFGVAWVAEVPGCDNTEPKGWQVEIVDTPQGILKKTKELIEWLNNPPSHLFDCIKGNDNCCNIRRPKCNLDPCDECFEEPCRIKEASFRCQEPPKKCRNICEDHEACFRPCCKDHRNSCEDREADCHPCYKDHRNSCEDREADCHPCYKDHRNSCEADCHPCCKDSTTCLDCKQPKCAIRFDCRRCDDDSSDDNCKPLRPKCRWSTMAQNDCIDGFKKESCCCHCQEKYFKNAGTNYDSDVVPQREYSRTLSSEMADLDSKVECAGIRTSQICRKIMDHKKEELIDKHERELTTVIGRSSDDESAKNLFINTSNNQSNAVSSQRRSSKFRRKETI